MNNGMHNIYILQHIASINYIMIMETLICVIYASFDLIIIPSNNSLNNKHCGFIVMLCVCWPDFKGSFMKW